MKFDLEFLDLYEQIQLDTNEEITLQDWVDRFVSKYKVVGKLIK